MLFLKGHGHNVKSLIWVEQSGEWGRTNIRHIHRLLEKLELTCGFADLQLSQGTADDRVGAFCLPILETRTGTKTVEPVLFLAMLGGGELNAWTEMGVGTVAVTGTHQADCTRWEPKLKCFLNSDHVVCQHILLNDVFDWVKAGVHSHFV